MILLNSVCQRCSGTPEETSWGLCCSIRTAISTLPFALMAEWNQGPWRPIKGWRRSSDNHFMDWLHWHLLDQIATEPDQSLLNFSPFCSLVSLLMPAQCLLVCTRILKETWRNICLDWKKTESRGNAGQKLAVQKSSFKFPSNYWHDTRSMPAIFFAVSNLVQSSRYQAGVIWLQSSQSIIRTVPFDVAYRCRCGYLLLK